LERVEILLELDGPVVADRLDVGDLCFAFLSLPVKPKIVVAERHNFLAAVALKDLAHGKDEVRLDVRKVLQYLRWHSCKRTSLTRSGPLERIVRGHSHCRTGAHHCAGFLR